MNKKTLQKKASLLLKQYTEMLSEQRNYENENWHCVNVKRRNDYVDMDDLLKAYPKQYREQLKNAVCNADGDVDVDLYYNWLDDLWDQLNYELGDIAGITKGSKDEHGAFQFIEIEHWGNDKMVLSLGRSGGWACFQDNVDDVEDILIAIIDWDVDEMLNYDMDIEYKNESLDDVVIKLNNIEAMMDEVVFIKNYIEKFNADANFTDEIKFRIEEEIGGFELENKSIAEDKSRLIQDLTAGINTMQTRLDAFKKNKELKNAIQRHLTGVVKTLKQKED